MAYQSSLKRALITGGIYTLLLSMLFILIASTYSTASAIFLALPFFVILYFIFFTLGRPQVSGWLWERMQGDIRYIMLFPLLLIVLYYGYIILNGDNPFMGTVFLVPYLLFFPVLVFAVKNSKSPQINWVDFLTFVLFFFPVTLVKINIDADLPYKSGTFDSVYRIAVMLTAIFAFVTVRNLEDAGCYPVFRWKYLSTTLWVWIAFYLFVFAIGYGVDFIRLSADRQLNYPYIEKTGIRFIAIFLHTALFEELVFRGLLQNMLGKRIGQAASWKAGWRWGLIILIPVALLAGYTLKGGMHWFPALITILLFGVAYGLEKKAVGRMGDYTALAITSVIFGLVHYHSGSIIFTGLACIGGWAYGYVYLKTKNVFYCALLHALVNTSPLIFGLELAK
ncbi:MAG: CPBP family intramembrane metalloprotease [Agriterribacter sp.]